MDKQRFFIPANGKDDNAYRDAIEYASKLAKEIPGVKKVVLLIYTKTQISLFDGIFGRETIMQLLKGKNLNGDNLIFKIETVMTYRESYNKSDIVITFTLDSEKLFLIDDYYSVQAIIAIPWLINDLDKWLKVWGPINIRNGNHYTVTYPEPTCIVKKAMQALTQSINMSTGITHPSDANLAKTYILALHKFEDQLDAEIVGAYLVRVLNWRTDNAQEIEKLIATLNNGSYFKGGTRVGLKAYYSRWKEACI